MFTYYFMPWFWTMSFYYVTEKEWDELDAILANYEVDHEVKTGAEVGAGSNSSSSSSSGTGNKSRWRYI